MNPVTAAQLHSILPLARAHVEEYIDPINAAMERFDINTPKRAAAFIAQIGHESAELTRVEENLNYGAPGLLAVFPDEFQTPAIAENYARQPERIASRVYAGRYGNGDEASGDGWKFRGRGLIQITFHDNYLEVGEMLGLPLLDDPDLLLTPVNAALSAAWFWDNRACNGLADAGDFRGVTRRINSALAGMGDRMNLWYAAKRALGA